MVSISMKAKVLASAGDDVVRGGLSLDTGHSLLIAEPDLARPCRTATTVTPTHEPLSEARTFPEPMPKERRRRVIFAPACASSWSQPTIRPIS
jgi:hypothetical protein